MFRPFGVGVWRCFSALGLAFLLLCSANAQKPAASPALVATLPVPQQQPQSQSGPKGDETIHPAGPESSKSARSNPDQSKSVASNSETKITPQQADQLFRDVDTILAFASKDSLLPVRRDVKRRLASREEVVTYLKKNMAEDKDVKRLRRTELVLKKFGLLPKDFDLQTFLVSLLEGVVRELRGPVGANELTHARKNQSLGLDKGLKRGEENFNTKKFPTPP